MRERMRLRARAKMYLEGCRHVPRSHPLFLFSRVVLKVIFWTVNGAVELLDWIIKEFNRDGWGSKASRKTSDATSIPFHQIALRGTPWLPIDHSNPEIKWEPIADSALLRNLRKVVTSYSPILWPRWYFYDALAEGTSTRNFRVVSGLITDPFLLRLHVGDAKRFRIENTQCIREWILDQGVFADSPVEHCLVPLTSKEGQTIFDVDFDFPVDPSASARFVEFFPYAHGVKHYRGTSKEQFRSFATQFGRLQASIRSIPKSSLSRLDERSEAYADSPQTLLQDFQEIRAVVKQRVRGKLVSSHVALWQNNEALVDAWVERCCEFLAQTHDEELTLLHDIHPHNTFFYRNRCVLIYDYEHVARWSHASVLAYSIHRFVRESVSKSIRQGDHAAEKEIPRMVEEFLELYAQSGNSIPNDLTTSLYLRIAASSLLKLRNLMMYGLGEWSDKHSRSPQAQYVETQKFLSFLAEASSFRM
jgi:hypothetical protein